MSVASSKTMAETAAEYGLSQAEYAVILQRLNRERGITVSSVDASPAHRHL